MPETAIVADMFTTAWHCHQSGDLARAEQLYQQILQLEPHQADVHHLLGVLASQQGHYEAGIASIRRALTLNPWVAAFHANLAVAQLAVGASAEAEASFQQALRLQPDNADTLHGLGNALLQQNRVEEAIGYFRQALHFRVDFPQAHNNLGRALLQSGAQDNAIAHFQEAIRLLPSYAEAQIQLGNALLEKGHVDQAAHWYRQALLHNPRLVEAHNNLGGVLFRQGKLEDAAASYRRAIQLEPGCVAAHVNLGIALCHQDKLDESVAQYVEALRLQPDSTDAHYNLGSALLLQGKAEEAIESFDQALKRQPHLAEARLNRALVWLQLGSWEWGWPEYEWRLQTADNPQPKFPQPRWDGSPLNGRTLLVVAEQGLGDTLQFIRYVQPIRRAGGKLVLQCQPPLRRLLACTFDENSLVSTGQPPNNFDVYVPLLSLPGLFRTSVATVPASIPYLQAGPALVEYWRRELTATKGLKIGIAWQGSPDNSCDRRRSMLLKYFEPLARVDGVQLISLQKGPGTEQLRNLADAFPVLDLGDRLDQTHGPFMDTAAIIKNLDLVISSDSAVAHLAGALAPVWVALTFVPDWRWLLHREDTPWYPTMRLFRQTRLGQWEDVFDRMARECLK